MQHTSDRAAIVENSGRNQHDFISSASNKCGNWFFCAFIISGLGALDLQFGGDTNETVG